MLSALVLFNKKLKPAVTLSLMLGKAKSGLDIGRIKLSQ
jgi:hypothetical protein